MEHRTSPRIPSSPHLVRKEAAAAVIALTVVCAVAAIWDAPLGGPADITGVPPEQVKAPWIFLGIQVMLRHLPPAIAGIVMPLAALVFVAAIPFLPERWRKVTGIIFSVVMLGGLVLTIWGYLG